MTAIHVDPRVAPEVVSLGRVAFPDYRGLHRPRMAEPRGSDHVERAERGRKREATVKAQSTLDALADAETLWLFARSAPVCRGVVLWIIRSRRVIVGTRRPGASARVAAHWAFRAVPGLRET